MYKYNLYVIISKFVSGLQLVNEKKSYFFITLCLFFPYFKIFKDLYY